MKMRYKERERIYEIWQDSNPPSRPFQRPCFIIFHVFDSLDSLKSISFPTPKTSLGWCLLLLQTKEP